jgi:hypothetical protein
MAEATQAALAYAANPGSHDSKPAKKIGFSFKKPPELASVQFSKASLGVEDNSAGERMDDIVGGMGRIPKETALTKETHEGYADFLKGHLTKLAKIYRDDPAFLREVSPSDAALLEKLIAKNDRGMFQTEISGESEHKLDQNIANFLKTQKGLIATTHAMDRIARLGYAALNMNVETNPAPTEEELTDREGEPLNSSEGPVGRPMRRLQRFLSERTASIEGRHSHVNILNIWQPPDWVPLPTRLWRRDLNIHDQTRAETGIIMSAASGIALLTERYLFNGLLNLDAGMISNAGALLLPWLSQGAALMTGKGMAFDHIDRDEFQDFIDADPRRID